MPLRVQIVSVAEIEITEAIDYYESCSSGLGSDFLCELEEALDRIARHPMAWHPIDQKTRRCLLRKFPYALLYCHTIPDTILVTALMALKMDPIRWQDRIS